MSQTTVMIDIRWSLKLYYKLIKTEIESLGTDIEVLIIKSSGFNLQCSQDCTLLMNVTWSHKMFPVLAGFQMHINLDQFVTKPL